MGLEFGLTLTGACGIGFCKITDAGLAPLSLCDRGLVSVMVSSLLNYINKTTGLTPDFAELVKEGVHELQQQTTDKIWQRQLLEYVRTSLAQQQDKTYPL